MSDLLPKGCRSPNNLIYPSVSRCNLLRQARTYLPGVIISKLSHFGVMRRRRSFDRRVRLSIYRLRTYIARYFTSSPRAACATSRDPRSRQVMADEDDGDDEAAAADGELNELDVRAAIARASNDDRDAEGARPVDPFDRPALDEPIKVDSRKTADLCPDCGIVVSLAQLPQSPTSREKEMPRRG